MHNFPRFRNGSAIASAFGQFIACAALGLLLTACGGSSDSGAADGGASNAVPVADGGASNAGPAAPGGASNAGPAAPGPSIAIANTVVAYPSEPAEFRLYAGQSRQLTLRFETSDGGSASDLALGLPAGGLPAGWSIVSNRDRCAVIDAGNACQFALAYAPARPEQPSVVTFPYSYRNNRGEPGAGSIAISYVALAANAATATLTPGGPVRGITGKTSSVVLSFGTNDGSAASDLHVEDGAASLPPGWSGLGAGFSCASFGAGAACELALNYAPASAAGASALVIRYGYKDSSGKEQAAKVAIDYSAVAPNTVAARQNPAGLIRATAGASQQATLTFTPSDSSPASGLRLLTDAGKLPDGWTVTASTLPCATVSDNGGCTLSLLYAPAAGQPAGMLELDYGYTDAAGRELTGKAAISYASRDYRIYVAEAGDINPDTGETGGGGVRQCELDGDARLSGCVKAGATWPLFGANSIAVYGGHAYIGAGTDPAEGIAAKPVTVCKVAEDNALLDCAGSDVKFEDLSQLQVSEFGAFILSSSGGVPRLTYCSPASGGGLGQDNCKDHVDNSLFKDVPDGVPTAISSTDTMLYISATDNATAQSLYSCWMLSTVLLKCNFVAIGAPEQVVRRMSSGQAGGKGYLYLATASRTDPEKVPGSIIKCALDANNNVAGCEKGLAPPGLKRADLIRIGDLRIVRNVAWLLTGDSDYTRKVFRCRINQQNGDLEACADAGRIEGIRNSGIMAR